MRIALALLMLAPTLGSALTLEFPANARLAAEDVQTGARYDMPTGPWASDGMPILSETGEMRQQAWQIDAAGITNYQILRPLRVQLEEAGFEILFECNTEGCGGFDFRFAQPVLPAPDMHVDLGDFLFVSARLDSELISLLVSRSSQVGYVQLTRVGNATDQAIVETDAAPIVAVRTSATGDFGLTLEQTGRVILSDLAFETGSAQLAEGSYETLSALADYLADNPDRRVALVGHTDSVGGLDGNIALSKRRAGSVLERLVSDYGVARRQLEAEGMGYLSPLASNLTEEGRTANRRVEVIVTSTQ